MNKKHNLLGAFFLFIGLIYGQHSLDSTLFALKSFEISKARVWYQKIDNGTLKDLLQKQILYYTDGKLAPHSSTANSPKSSREAVLKDLLESDIKYLSKNVKDNENIFMKYFKVLNQSKKLNDTLLITEALRKINQFVLERARDTSFIQDFLEQYKTYSGWSVTDSYWYNYFEIGYEFLRTEKKVEAINTALIDASFAQAFKNARDNELLNAKMLQSYGNYLAHWKKDYQGANTYFEKAHQIYAKFEIKYATNKMASIAYNIGINHYKLGDYDRAIPIFLNDLNRDKEPLFKAYTHDWLQKCYDSIGDYKKALYHVREMKKIEENMQQLENASKVSLLKKRFDFESIEKKLNEKVAQNDELKNNLNTLIPILGLITLILAVIFYLYRRYRKKSTVLEEEKSETLQKLDELKQIVVKNHIVLKDKTKVYIADLMYVKADDHYLNLFLSNGKNHFVRGKLKNIKEELPPNFIQCHRSYVVNVNFIKQKNSTSLIMINQDTIPLSRSFKDRF